ncbi:hypothetical protein [Parashewanella curva]|uniref:hypothetical protein n=1 Tax=Parashewanella curva TaxID=2338552 RepID=UPI001404B3F9|nr:hypothetical protein [Parashewanella curva]
MHYPGAKYSFLLIFIINFDVSLGLWWILDKLVGLRVSKEQELQGLELLECGMEAYPEFTTR